VAEKILIVHDDHATRVGLAATLTEAGYDAIAVSSLGTALHALTEDHPDLLLTDLQLSESTGLQLLALNPRRIPAIILAEFPDHVLEAEARHLGADYLVTPVTPGAVVDLVRQKLHAGADTAFTPTRRWSRRSIADDWHVRVGDSLARVVDVSYGGVCIEVQRVPGAWLPMSFPLVLPTSRSYVDVNVVWKRRNSDETWVCGAAVSDADRMAWQRIVDSLS
jgi:CheY-like chemotaxis protein